MATIEGDLTEVSSEILPDYDLDLVVFNCTSSFLILGDEAIESAIKKSKPIAKVLTTSQAVASNFRREGK
ncbi:MAG: hypothetical protein QGG07_04195 [Dehalococcoidales bacterium]|nr:hypothetical protein [Dehalococcoidales bacterium]